MTFRRALSAVCVSIAGLTGCLNPPPRAETPGTPAASQTSAPPGASGDQTTVSASGVWFVSPALGGGQKISGMGPLFPQELRVDGRSHAVSAKICVSTAGRVDNVSILSASETVLATNVVNAVKDWRFSPLVVNGGRAVPFCYVTNFKFEVI